MLQYPYEQDQRECRKKAEGTSCKVAAFVEAGKGDSDYTLPECGTADEGAGGFAADDSAGPGRA